MDWKSKVILVTGASSGIGAALCRDYLQRGAFVAMAARNLEKMQEIANGFPQDQVLAISTDVSKEEDCREFVAAAVEKFGGIDVLINNAGISMRALFQDLNLDILKHLIDVNFWGTVYCTHAAMPYLLKSKGSLCGVSSIAGYQGLPARSGYSASKFAMHGFLNTIRIETLKQGLHVMIACPNFTASNIRNNALTADGDTQGETPLDENKLMSSEKVASIIIRGIERRKRTSIISTEGKLIVLFGKILPAWLDKKVYKRMKEEKNSPFNKK